MGERGWYGIRTIYEHLNRAQGRDRVYEERIVIVQAISPEEAIEKAEREAESYANEGVSYLGYAIGFHMFGPPGEGIEVFSLMRDSRMEPNRYLDRFFDTGRERSLARPDHP